MYALVLVIHAMFGTSASQAAPRSKASGVPSSVESVVSGGYWEAGNGHGRYRVIVENIGWEHVTSRVYIEWIAERPHEQRLAVVATAVLDELVHNWSIGSAKIRPSKGAGPLKSGATLELPATNAYDLRERKFVLELEGPGHYRVRSGA